MESDQNSTLHIFVNFLLKSWTYDESNNSPNDNSEDREETLEKENEKY